MLHLRRDRLIIGLARDRIEWIRVAGRLKPKVVAQCVESIGATDNSGDSKYAALLARLSEICRQAEWQNVDVTILLSSGIARYLSFPKHPDISQAEELKTLALHHFVQVYGDAANNWSIKLNACKTGENIASAVESNLLEGLREIFSINQQRLISIQPALMASFNLHKKELPNRGCGWFVFSENGYLTFALIGDGQWRYVQTRRGTSIDLLQWLERENLSGRSDMPCYEIWHTGIDRIDTEGLPFKLHALKAYPGMDIDPEQYRLALYGGC